MQPFDVFAKPRQPQHARTAKLNALDVIEALSNLFILRGISDHIRCVNGPEYIAQDARDWIAAVGAKTAYIEPGSPRDNGYRESFNARFRDELLNGEVLYTLKEARTVIESRRRHYNTARLRSSQGYHPPARSCLVACQATRTGFALNSGRSAGARHALKFKAAARRALATLHNVAQSPTRDIMMRLDQRRSMY